MVNIWLEEDFAAAAVPPVVAEPIVAAIDLPNIAAFEVILISSEEEDEEEDEDEEESESDLSSLSWGQTSRNGCKRLHSSPASSVASSSSRISSPASSVASSSATATDGPSTAGPSTAGPSRAGPSRAGPSTAGPSRAGPSTAGPSRAGHSRALKTLDGFSGPLSAGGRGPAVIYRPAKIFRESTTTTMASPPPPPPPPPPPQSSTSSSSIEGPQAVAAYSPTSPTYSPTPSDDDGLPDSTNHFNIGLVEMIRPPSGDSASTMDFAQVEEEVAVNPGANLVGEEVEHALRVFLDTGEISN